LKSLRLLIGIAISVALFAALLWSVDLRELADQLRRTEWTWAALSVVLAPFGLWVRARRWRYLFPPRAEPPGLVPAMMIGYMANNVLPLRAGEFVRVYVVARRWGHGFWTTLATLVVERVLDSLAIVLILGVLVLLEPVPAIFRWTALTLLAIDVIAVAALSFLAVAPALGHRIVGRLTRPWPALAQRAERGYETFVHGLDGIRTPGHLLPLLLWTIAVWVVPAMAAWTALRAVHLDLPLLAGWTVVAFVGLGVSIPSAPGYVGVFHYAAVLAVEMFGVPRAAGLGFALIFHACQIIPVTVTGWLYLLREHVSLTEAARASAPASASAD
jgi:uncharacterized protein (TIRG00374 family)